MTDSVCEFESLPARQSVALNDIAGLAVRPFAALAGFYRRRKALERLAVLDDHMLRDIGLHRIDLADAATLSTGEDVTRFLQGRVNERRYAEQRRTRGR
jgi:uncharacterized protein YjiS (DUF1127 family)